MRKPNPNKAKRIINSQAIVLPRMRNKEGCCFLGWEVGAGVGAGVGATVTGGKVVGAWVGGSVVGGCEVGGGVVGV